MATTTQRQDVRQADGQVIGTVEVTLQVIREDRRWYAQATFNNLAPLQSVANGTLQLSQPESHVLARSNPRQTVTLPPSLGSSVKHSAPLVTPTIPLQLVSGLCAQAELNVWYDYQQRGQPIQSRQDTPEPNFFKLKSCLPPPGETQP